MWYAKRVVLIGLIVLAFNTLNPVGQQPETPVRQWLMEPIGDAKERGAGKAERLEWATRGFKHQEEWTPQLIEWAAHGKPPIRERAIAALAEFAVQRLVLENPVGDGESFQKTLIANLKDPDAAIRARSANALAFCRGPSAVAPLIKTMADPNKRVRIYATDAVGHYNDRRALEPLLSALKDPNPEVRGEAPDALWGFGPDKRIIKALIDALFDPASGLAAGNITFALERLGVQSQPIRETMPSPPIDEHGHGPAIVGYRVKIPGEDTWREHRWSK